MSGFVFWQYNDKKCLKTSSSEILPARVYKGVTLSFLWGQGWGGGGGGGEGGDQGKCYYTLCKNV